jgi:hypothetical protein
LSGRDKAAPVASPWEPNLSWLTDDLAVGGRFPVEEAGRLARDLGIRAVVDLRSEARDDEAVLREHGLTFLHLPTLDHHAVAPRMLGDGVAFASRHLDRGERVLVHCERGIGRSALLALCVLVSRGMAPLEALELAKSRRSLVSPSPAQYEAWVRWLAAFRREHDAAWDVPDFDAFAAIAYRHLRGAG